MNFIEFRKELFDCANALGCSAAEVYFEEGTNFNVNVLGQEIDRYTAAVKFGLNLRVKYQGKDGYAYTEVFEDAQTLVKHAIDNAKAIENEDEHPMQGKCKDEDVGSMVDPFSNASEQEKIKFAYDLEQAVKAKDERVLRTSYCMIDSGSSTVHISNTMGLDAKETTSISAAILGVIMQQGVETKEAFAIEVGEKAGDTEFLVDKAVHECLEKFNATPVKSGEYKVLFRNSVMAEMLETFWGQFSADAAQKGLTLMANKEGTKVASDIVNLIDDPKHKIFPRAFDGEGTPSVTKHIIENGVLKTLMHNLKTAKKANVESTSNAGRAGTAGAINVSPTNMYLQSGVKSYDDMVKTLKNGIIITALEGTLSGANDISGEFSFGAKGLLVENGNIVKSVDQITVAGSFYELLQDIEEIGSDFRFSTGGEGGLFGAASVIIKKLMVAGE
ncbi:MAG: TldD/PmbA family protein [Clostridiales bacterium]|nr:TldD/PmbA family protein [Clostridiales bacterium]